MKRPRGRTLAIIAAVLVVVAAAGVAALHLDFVQQRVLRAALNRFVPDGTVRATRLDYDLVRLRFAVEGLELYSVGSETPYFTADRVEADAPWAAWRTPRLERLTLIAPRFAVSVAEDGASNFTGGGARIETPFPIGVLELRGLSIDYRDARQGLALSASQLQVQLTADAATSLLQAPGGVDLRRGDAATSIRLERGTLGWDGSDLPFRDLAVESDPASAAVDGEVARLLSDRELGLDAEADLRLDEIYRLALGADTLPDDEGLDGELSINARIDGPPDALRVQADLRSDSIARGQFALRDFGATVRFDDTLVVEDLTGAIGGGEIGGRVELAGGGAGSTASLWWQRVPLADAAARLPDALQATVAATRTNGTVEATWPGWTPALDVARTEVTLEFDSATNSGLVGQIAGTLDAGALAATGEVAAPSLSSSIRLDGTGRVQTESPWIDALAMDVAARADLASALAAWSPPPAVSGALRLEGRVEGTALTPRFDGRATLARSASDEASQLDVTAALRADAAEFQVTDLTAIAAGIQLRGDLSGTTDATALRGQFTAEVDDPDATFAVAAMAPPVEDLRGNAWASVEFNVTGAEQLTAATLMNALQASGRVEFREFRAGTATPTAGAADFTLASGRWSLADAEFEATGARVGVTATGTVDLEETDADIEFRIEDLAEVVAALPADLGAAGWPAVSGPLAGEATIRGGHAAFTVGTQIRGEGLMVAGRGPFAFEADAEHATSGTRINRLAVTAAGAEVLVQGIVGPGASTLDLISDVRIERPAALAQLDWLEPLTRVSGTAAIGNDRETGNVIVDLWDLRADLPPRVLSSPKPGRVVWGPEGLRVDRLELISGDTRLEASGTLPRAEPGELAATIAGRLEDIDDLVQIAWERGEREGPAPDLGGAFDIRLTANGTVDDWTPGGSISLRGASAAAFDLDPVQDLTLSAEVTPTTVRVDEIRASWRGAALRGTANLDLGLLPLPEGTVTTGGAESELQLQLLGLTPRVLEGFLPATVTDDLGGEAMVTVDLQTARAELASVRGNVRFDALRFWRRELSVEQTRPTRISLADGRLSIDDLDLATDAGPVVGMSGGVLIDPEDPANSELDFALNSDVDLAQFAGFVSWASITGQVALETQIQGTPRQPRMHGEIRLEGVGAALREPRFAIADLRGTIELDGTQVNTEGLQGYSQGGDLMVFLNLDLADPFWPTGLAGVTARGVALQAAGVRADADVSLTLTARGREGGTVLGSVNVREGGYRSTAGLTQASLGRFGAPADVTTDRVESFIDLLRYDIRVLSDDNLIVDTRYADLGLALDLQVVGSGTSPGLLGDIRLNEGGQIRLAGNTLLIDRGAVEFANSSIIAPTLDIEASSRVRTYDVSVSLSGSAFSPSLQATASGGLSQADALSLLATGRTLQEAGSAGTEILTEQAFNVLAGRTGGIAQSVGISSVRFEQAQAGADYRSLEDPDLFPRTTDLSARLSVSRAFGDVFELIYSQGLTQSTDQSWIGVLKLPWNVRAQAGTFDDGSRSVEVQHSFQLGRPNNDPGRTRRAAQTRVDDVQVVGNPGRDAAEIVALLRLRPGNAFDFIDWRRDIERIEREYRNNGHYEASVRARRTPVGTIDPDTGRAARVLLEYSIEQGPRTVLSFEGFSPRRGTIETMRDRWTDAVNLGFLLEDLEREARRALVQRGYVRGTATATVVSDTSDERHVRVTATPGTRFGRVRLEIRGAATVTADAVRNRLRDADLERGLWFAEADTVAAVRGLYLQSGLPDATVEILPPVLDGDTATAIMSINEGDARRLATIAFDGNTVLTRDALLDATGLVPGAVVTRALIDTAVVELDGVYQELGYGDVIITSRTALTEAGTSLTFRIQENAPRVVRSIEVRGRQRTRESVINRAIGLKVGDRVTPLALQGARRRLLRSGALQSASVQLEPAGNVTDGEKPMRLVVTVVEKAMFDIRYGVQLLSDTLDDQRRTRPGVSASVAHDNLLGIGARVSVLGRYRTNEPFGRAALSFPRFVGLPIRTTLIAQRSREQTGAEGAFTVRREETRFLGEQRVEYGRFTFGYSYSWERSVNTILELPPDSPFQLAPITVTRLIPTLIYDSRDDLFAPRSGLFHSSTYEVAIEELGSELNFTKYFGQQYAFFEVGPIVSATAVRFGSGKSLDPNSAILPAGELFTVGGGTTVRGYPDDSLGRTEFFGSFFAGGNASLILNQEFRFPVWRWFEGVAFVDAGSAFESAAEIRLPELAFSTGAGLRLVTPYITLRLDYGFRLTDVDYLEPATGGFHFGIGHIF